MKRTPLKRASTKRASELRLYAKESKLFLSAYPACQVCLDFSSHDPFKCRRSTQVHHKRGRMGRLLLDNRFFLAVCDEHHAKIHDLPKWARMHGYLSSATDWNTYPTI